MKLQLKDYLNLLRQVRCFVICGVKNGIIRLARNLTQNVIRETTDVEQKIWIMIEFWCVPELMANLEDDLSFETTHSLPLLRNDSRRENILS